MDRIHFSRLILTPKLSYGKIIKEVKRNAATNVNTNTCMTYVFEFSVIIICMFFKINKHMSKLIN